LPLAINHQRNGSREPCIECFTCDTYPCAISAKNDLPTVVLEPLVKKGLQIATKMAAIRLHAEGSRVTAVECFDKTRGEPVTYRAKSYVLSGGALASPHLLLASGLEALNPAGELVGRFLMRHCNAVAFGVFPSVLPSNERFHKQIGIHDYYFGHPTVRSPTGKLGCIQQIHVPPIPLIKHYLPAALRFAATPLLTRASGLIVIAEDQPQAANRINVGPTTNGFGMPRPTLTHHYTKRDLAARKALLRAAKRLFRSAGAMFSGVHRVRTFSHAVGTLRAGPVPEQAPLDGHGAFRGVDNLFVADASFMPRSAGVNPSLTIAANALRVGERLCAL
jgi:choline dehydrogenase-like flavoprotein